jgi:hypothetical protein
MSHAVYEMRPATETSVPVDVKGYSRKRPALMKSA